LDFDHFHPENLKFFEVVPKLIGRTARDVRDPLGPSRRATAVDRLLIHGLFALEG
jgi:hypothetical protein